MDLYMMASRCDSCSKTLKSTGQKIDNLIIELDCISKECSDQWAGCAAEAFQNKIYKVINKVKSCESFVNTAKNRYDDANAALLLEAKQREEDLPI